MSDGTPPEPQPPRPTSASTEAKTVLQLLKMTTELFTRHRVEAPRLEAELLLAHVLGCERIQLYVRFDQPLGDAEVAAFRELVKRRGRHEPVQYILGRREFWSLDLAVREGVLIPRPETECLVEEALAHLRAHPDARRVGDVGTGSGAIAIALAKEVPAIEVWAGDIAEVPLAVAAENVVRHGLAERVHVVAADLLAGLAHAAGGPFAVVVSNPPYIADAAYATLEPHVKREPELALRGGADGLDLVRRLASELAQGLAEGGALFVEIDADQGERAIALMAPRFAEVRVRKDYAGRDRVLVATGFRG